jgi:hypothetical protein
MAAAPGAGSRSFSYSNQLEVIDTGPATVA